MCNTHARIYACMYDKLSFALLEFPTIATFVYAAILFSVFKPQILYRHFTKFV